MINLKNDNLPSNETFGFFFAAVTLIIGGYIFINLSKIFGYLFFITSIIFLVCAIFNPKLLKTLNKLWMKLGYYLGFIITPIILGLIYFFLFTPISLLMKLFKRDELRINFKNKKSYWLEKKEQVSKNFNFKNQF